MSDSPEESHGSYYFNISLVKCTEDQNYKCTQMSKLIEYDWEGNHHCAERGRWAPLTLLAYCTEIKKFVLKNTFVHSLFNTDITD